MSTKSILKDLVVYDVEAFKKLKAELEEDDEIRPPFKSEILEEGRKRLAGFVFR